jgi:hypothetical protein
MDIEVMAQVQALDGSEGVFLGTTDDEAGDDVQDTHPGRAQSLSLGSVGRNQG